MPAERLMPIADVVALLRQYDWSHQRRVSFEYICFCNQSVNGQLVNNTTLRHANELIRLLKGLNCRINLIRFHENPTGAAGLSVKRSVSDNGLSASAVSQLTSFRDYLSSHGLTTTIRRSRGEDILAACGMLVNSLQN